MNKSTDNKFFDVRTMHRYLKNGEITQKEVEEHLQKLPNDENNFELVMIEEDDIGLGIELSDEELGSMPSLTEDNVDNFDFLPEEKSEK